MRLTLRQLDIFRAIAQHGSTVNASAALALSQSATSSALQELESALETRLFDRVGKRLVLNANGQALLPQAVRLLEAATQIEKGFEGHDRVARLTVGCSTTIGSYLMPILMEAHARHHPGVRIEVVIGNSTDIARQAAQLSIDLGLIEGPCHLPELSVRPWFEDELVIIAAADDPLAQAHPVTRQALRRAPWLMREAGSGTAEEVAHRLTPYLGHLDDTRRIGSSEAIKRMVAAGLGISCLSYWVVSDLIAQGQLAMLDHDLPAQTRQLHVVHHRDKFLSRALDDFQHTLDAFALAQGPH